jgi:starch phosphorylase
MRRQTEPEDSTVHALVAYFSMEYGLHEEFPSYAGGLGVLAGDFMKSAGDLGMPVVGIGLRWAQGYTAQRIGEDGQPVDEWHEHKPDFLTTPAPGCGCGWHREVDAACGGWRATRSRRSFYSSPPIARPLDHRRLYDPARLPHRQEMLLGIGGVRALQACTSRWTLPLQRGTCGVRRLELIADRMEAGRQFEEAWAAVRPPWSSPPTPRCRPATRRMRSPISTRLGADCGSCPPSCTRWAAIPST